MSKELDSSTIRPANDEVTAAVESSSGKRSVYLKLNDEQRATIGKYAAQHGIVKAIHHFAKDFKDEPLKESTVCGKSYTWKSWKYEEERKET